MTAFATKRKKPDSKEGIDRPRAPAKRATKRLGGGNGLTAERIRDEALRLIDADGLEAFSTRRLGAALGCEAMAIYWYYPSKDALLDAVVEALIARLPIEPSVPGDWLDAFRKLAHAYRRLAHLHPRSFPLLAMRRFATEGTWRFLDDLFELAHGAGLDDQTTAMFYRLVSSYCGCAALEELAALKAIELARSSPAVAEAAAAREAFPRLSAVFSFLEPARFDEAFSFGLELMLDALRRAPKGAIDHSSDRSRPKPT